MDDTRLRHNIDRLWCDVHGVYVTGWAHALDAPILALRMSSGDTSVETRTFVDRPDVASHFENPNIMRCGFSLYLACAPFRPVVLSFVTSSGAVELPLEAPPAAAEPPLRPDPMETFVAEMALRGGTVVEIGARVVGPGSTLQASRFPANCRHVGVDIHPATGVDVVVDAHQLSSAFASGSVSGVFSLAVMEHLAMPWLVAAEISTVLAVGGLVYHVMPQTFPVHETPNDFWRMTDEALKVLYGPSLGFEIIEAAMFNPVQIYTAPSLRQGPFLEMPLHPGMATSYIIARKVEAIPIDVVRWPVAAERLRLQSQSYPLHPSKAGA